MPSDRIERKGASYRGTSALSQGRILLIDEDPIILNSFGDLLEADGYDVIAAPTGSEAVQRLRGSHFDVVVADLASPERDGFEILRDVKRICPGTAVILITSYGSVAMAVEAIRAGASDYLTKPLTADEFKAAIEGALERRGALRARADSSTVGSKHLYFPRIVGEDYRMLKVFEMVDAVADSQTTVLITGESGTGKTLIARAIHARSSRRDGPFVEVPCGAIPDTLLESELFGHVRGAFTDAIRDKPGKFEIADGGTIFLDEVSTGSAQLQVKLLRILQEHEFEPVGANETRTVDVRVLLATNKDLWAEVVSGRFRKDLYYRINVVNIEVPPLRDRITDIPILADHFLEKYNESTGKRVLGFSAGAMEMLQRYSWGGNVRELENCVERGILLTRGAYITPDELPAVIVASAEDSPTEGKGGTTLREVLTGEEKRTIRAALLENKGNRGATARQLGINRTTLYKKMRRHGLEGM